MPSIILRDVEQKENNKNTDRRLEHMQKSGERQVSGGDIEKPLIQIYWLMHQLENAARTRQGKMTVIWRTTLSWKYLKSYFLHAQYFTLTNHWNITNANYQFQFVNHFDILFSSIRLTNMSMLHLLQFYGEAFFGLLIVIICLLNFASA